MSVNMESEMDFDDKKFYMNYLDGLTDDMPDEFFRLAQVFELNLFEPVRIDGSSDIYAAYIMNEFSVITYGFKERHILESVKTGKLDESYHCTRTANPLYSMVRLEDIAALNEAVGLQRGKIIAADGPANYIRPYLNALTEEEFEEFIHYHLATCERMDLMGASGHTVDILSVQK